MAARVAPDLMSASALAKKLRKSKDTVRRWTEAGMLPTITDPDSGRVYYPSKAIDRWLENAGKAS